MNDISKNANNSVREQARSIQIRLEKRHGANASKIMARLRELKSQVPTTQHDIDDLRRNLNLPHTSPKRQAAIERIRVVIRNRLEQATILRNSGLNEEAMGIEEDVENYWEPLLRKSEVRL
jgi:hypothetical protein